VAVDLSHITRCMDLQERDIAAALGDRERTRALLEHLQSVSGPNAGVAKVLLVLARMATTACDWVDGDLTIEVQADGETTRLDVATELGGGLRERVFSPLVLQAPLVEFTRALERVPHMVAPLSVRGSTRKRIVLTATAALRRTTMPPPPVEIAPESLFVRLAPLPSVSSEVADQAPAPLPVVGPAPRASSDPPADIDAGWDD
jgi:hypothetical protein